MSKWYEGKAIKGRHFGTSIGFPTLNLDKSSVLRGKTTGVYTCRVKIKNKIFKGLLFYGPRLIHKEKRNSLEIFVLDFNKEIYGKKIFFQLLTYLRPAIKFNDIKSLKRQLEKDCAKIDSKPR